MPAPLNWISTGNRANIKTDYGIKGLIIYEFLLPDGHVYIGQTSKGEERFKQHFGNTYYYSLGKPQMDTEEAPDNLYKYLRKAPWSQVTINYEYQPFGISYETLDAFRKHFRFKSDMNIATKDLYEYAILNYAEVLHIYRAVKTYGANNVLNKQMGGKSDLGLYTVSFQNGKVVPGTLVLSQGSSIVAATDMFNDKGQLLEELQKYVNNKVNSQIKQIYQKAITNASSKGFEISYKDLIDNINNIITKTISLDEIQKTLNLNFIPELKSNPGTNFGERTSVRKIFIESYKKDLKKRTNKTFKNLDSLFKQLEQSVSFSLLTIEDIFTPETIQQIKQQSGVEKMHINKMTQKVPRELFKYEAFLRFNDIFVNERDKIEPQWNTIPFHTRKNDNRKRHENDEDKLPYIEFTPNRNAGALKSRIFQIYKDGGFYYGSNWDSYYGHFMALVAGKHDVAFLRNMPLSSRKTKEQGSIDDPTARQQYTIYIHTDLSWESAPTTQPIEADKVWAAYITKSGEDSWIKDMLNTTLTNITDY